MQTELLIALLVLAAIGVLMQLALWLRKPVVDADELAHRQTLAGRPGPNQEERS